MVTSTYPKVADQILTLNKNIIEVLTKLNSVTTTNESSINVQIINDDGVSVNYSMPSLSTLKSEIDRLNNNINSLYSIDANGSIIQGSNNKFRKIITVDLNREPLSIGSVGTLNTFKSTANWFFDSLLDPMLSVEIDLTDKIEDSIRKTLVRRYIIDFAKNSDGTLTNLGQSALNSFNDLFKGNPNIVISEFENWYKTTGGIVEPLNPKYDEQIFDLEPNSLLYDGEFSVLRIQEDRLNRKLWYVLDKLNYSVVDTNDVKQLAINDELIINTEKTSTRYKILEISTIDSSPKVRLERVEGLEAIPVGISTLKIYSPVIYTKKLKVSVGYNERNVIFIKSINSDNNLIAKKWSLGTGFYTNDLRLNSQSDANGLTMEQFYIDYVYDYGIVLQDLVAKKTPNKLAGITNPPLLNSDNFKVVQINKHLTDSADSNLIKQKHNYQMTLKSEITQLDDAIIDRNKKLKVTKFKNDSAKKQSELEIDEIQKRKESKSKLLASVTQEIITLSKNPNSKVEPKFRLRGFWNMPEAIITRGTKPQEVVQFRVQYRYISKDGKEMPVEQFNVDGTSSKASFSNWIEFKTDARKRVYDVSTGEYYWEIQDIENADTPNINQLDLAMQNGERIEIRIKSISEVGWPESPVESDWSSILTYDFPNDLNNIANENDFILKEATKEDLKVSLNNELSAKGLDSHLSDSIVINGVKYDHSTSKILSGMKDNNGQDMSLLDYLKYLQDRITTLEEKVKRAKGELDIVMVRNGQEFSIKNGSETVFNIECEDYLQSFTGQSIPTGRVYENSIYVIKDFVLKIRNKSLDSPLGLLSNRTYLQNTDVYNTTAPQTFWVNEQDELLASDTTGQTRTQINNQFIWMVNYDSVTDNSVSKVSENIGNLFNSNNSNSITSILSSTEYNIGYNETNVLSFIGNNKSLLDPSKWIDTNTSVASTTKLLTSIHPVIKDLESITETNSDKIKTLNAGDSNSILIPINIYFKMNSLDSNQSGVNYQYVVLTNSNQTVKHIKKIRFFMENESENRPFVFTVKFNINRNRVIIKKTANVANKLNN